MNIEVLAFGSGHEDAVAKDAVRKLMAGKAWGFRQEDVDVLNGIVEAADNRKMVPTDMTMVGYSIIDRIAALLPPEEGER